MSKNGGMKIIVDKIEIEEYIDTRPVHDVAEERYRKLKYDYDDRFPSWDRSSSLWDAVINTVGTVGAFFTEPPTLEKCKEEILAERAAKVKNFYSKVEDYLNMGYEIVDSPDIQKVFDGRRYNRHYYVDYYAPKLNCTLVKYA